MASEFRLLPVVFSRLAFQIPLTACLGKSKPTSRSGYKKRRPRFGRRRPLWVRGFEALSVNRTMLFQKAVIKGRCYNKPYRSISVRAILSFLDGRTSIPPRFAKAARALREARAGMSEYSGVLRRCRSVQRACRPLRRFRGYSPTHYRKGDKKPLDF